MSLHEAWQVVPIAFWVAAAIPKLLADGSSQPQQWGGLLEMTALACVCAVLIFLLTKFIPGLLRDHREERKEWSAAQQVRDDKFLEKFDECSAAFICHGRHHTPRQDGGE